MSTTEVVIAALATKAVPKDYTVAPAAEIVPLCITASLDGSAAVAPFYGTVEFLSDSGLVMGRFPCTTIIPAAGSADISWFPLGRSQSASATQSTYETLVLSNPHLRAYYKLDETSGTTMLDSGPLALNGTYESTPTLGQPPLADGYSAVFGAASLEYANVVGIGGVVGTGEMAVAAWVKTSMIPGANPPELVCSDDNNRRYFQFRMETTGKLGMVNFDSPAFATPYSITSPGTINDGAKHFVVGTLSTAGTQTLYIDGAQVAQNVAALPTLSTRAKDLQVAGRLVSGPPVENSFTGTLDEIAIYNYPLTAAEVAALYAAGT